MHGPRANGNPREMRVPGKNQRYVARLPYFSLTSLIARINNVPLIVRRKDTRSRGDILARGFLPFDPSILRVPRFPFRESFAIRDARHYLLGDIKHALASVSPRRNSIPGGGGEIFLQTPQTPTIGTDGPLYLTPSE